MTEQMQVEEPPELPQNSIDAAVKEAIKDEPPIPGLDATPFPAFEPEKVVRPTKLVPIELKNVNLSIELRVPAEAGEEFGRTQKLLTELREKFGRDALIEELAQVLTGVVESVRISYPEPAPSKAVTVPQQAPVSVSIPQTQADIANYPIEANCPWKGNSLKNLDPASIYKILYDPGFANQRSLMSQQDMAMMSAYYEQWYEAQQQKYPPGTGPMAQSAIRFDDDNIPF